jgi:pyruvate dehydrogenase E2 component (dihydrolipoamide acetyltransferase)
MPKIPIIMPQLGESIAEATVVRLTANVGEQIETDQEVLEVETNKAVMGVTTPCPGVLHSFIVEVNETYDVGSVLGYIEASVEDAERLNAAQISVASHGFTNNEQRSQDFFADSESESPRDLQIPMSENGARFQSPRVRARLLQLGFHPQDIGVIPGTGAANRVTLRDLESYVTEVEQHPSKKASPMRLAVAWRSRSRGKSSSGVLPPTERSCGRLET